MRLGLLAVAVCGLAAAAATIALRDPDTIAIVTLAIGVSVGVGALAARVLLGRTRRRARSRPGAMLALRRGGEIGAAVGILVALRAIDGLTPLTAGFVVLGLTLAEVTLTARAS